MIENLYESVKNLGESTLPQKLTKTIGMEESQANDFVKKLSFTEYLELANAVDTGDTAKVQSLTGMMSEADNSFSTFSKPGQTVGSEEVDQNKASDENKKRIDDLEAALLQKGGDPEDLEETSRLRELAGLKEATLPGSFEIEYYNEVTGEEPMAYVYYEYEAAEAQTNDSPAYETEVNIISVVDQTTGEEVLDKMSPNWIDNMQVHAYELELERAASDQADRGDYMRDMQRDEMFDDVDRMKQLAGVEVDETATAGGTGAGGIASAPAVTGETRKRNSHPGTIVGSDEYTGY